MKPAFAQVRISMCLLSVGMVLPFSSWAQSGVRLGDAWKTNGFAVERFVVEGIGSRNNPLRRQVKPSFDGDELFVRFRLRYDAASIDDTENGNGEFFVLWLDAAEGADGSTHSNNVPNVGIHVDSKGKNRFMIRYNSGTQRFASPLKGDEESLLVARLWKSIPGKKSAFDRLDLWVNPSESQEFQPHASAHSAKSISQVSWIGFSTGAKTEPGDKIEVSDIDLATSWRSILDLPQRSPKEPVERVRPKTVSFKKDVYPVLSEHCFKCHAGDEAEVVRLDVLDEALNQTSPRDSKSSRLIELVKNGEMPPEGDSLSPDMIRILAAWIDEGMEWDEELLPTPAPTTDHWAFQPIRQPKIPTVKRTNWVLTPVDAFIAAKQESVGLTPNAPADASVLRRRLSLDILGLPPEKSIDNVDIETLLADPAYGQRWARYWLDLARWAESNGHQHNRSRPHAWRYRDWVVDAFNSDMPFDKFLRMQIAGDLMEAKTQSEQQSNLIATGFLASARYSGNELSKEIQRNDILVDIANTTSSVVMGLTMECAQCHTHKFDPVSIRDYYRFQAFFADAQPENVVFSSQADETKKVIDRRWEIFDRVQHRMVNIKRKQGHPEPIYVTPKSVIGSGMTPVEKKEFSQLEKRISGLRQTWGYVSSAHKRWTAPSDIRWPLPRWGESQSFQTTILVRGDIHSRGPAVEPGWPAVFADLPANKTELSRLDLANWLASDRHPLTARVWVNRIWQWHFGRGLVETSSDFGTQGNPPSHPELLDYLASELIDSGWSTNHIHRLILHSATYQLSNRDSKQNAAIDPENRLYWRWTPRRLDAEVIRDSILAVSRQLDLRSGGISVKPSSPRRMIYLRQERERFPHQQLLFDGAKGNVSCSVRRVSTSPLQSLWLINSEFVQSSAKTIAGQVKTVDEAFVRIIKRHPTDDERRQLEDLNKEYGMASVCLAILNSSEFVYLP